jgi:hypothetical protein
MAENQKSAIHQKLAMEVVKKPATAIRHDQYLTTMALIVSYIIELTFS